jgi:hypothetical protein
MGKPLSETHIKSTSLGGIRRFSDIGERKKQSERILKYYINHPEAKIYLSKINSGKNHPNWIGDRSLLERPDEWDEGLKEQIRERDNHRCQECFRHQDELRFRNVKFKKLAVHHIDYDKKNCNPMNLISLCDSCHMQTNYKRGDWTDYFRKRVKNR